MFELLLKHSSMAFSTGELSLARGWPLLWMWAAMAVALVLVCWTLWRQRRLGLWRCGVLAALQLSFIAVVLLALWRPVLRVQHIRDQGNVVALLVDASPSMTGGAKPRRDAALDALQVAVLPAVQRSASLRRYEFTDHARPIDAPADAPSMPVTRVGTALREVLQSAGSVPLAAVVLVSDGAENGDSLDEAGLRAIAAAGIPVHTVGVGPLAASNDLELAQVTVDEDAAVGDTLRAQVSIAHQQQLSARLRVYDGGQLRAALDVALRSGAGLTTTTVDVPLATAGLHDLRFEVDALPAETNVANNTRSAVVDVSARRRSVLYVEGEPRWEYKFIRRAMEGDAALRLVSMVRATPNRWYRQGVGSPQELVSGFPADAASLFAYDAVVIGSLSAATLNDVQHAALRDFVDRRGGGLLMLGARDGLGDGGWSRAPVAQVLPAALPVSAPPTFVVRNVRARPTVYGLESPLLQLGASAADTPARWNGLPLLTDVQSLGALRPGATVLLEALANGVAQPLLVTQRYGRGSSWLMGTASTWHWQMRLSHDDGRHGLFWRQLLHGLAAGAPQQISLRIPQRVFDDQSAIPVEAEILDAQFKPVNDAVVSIDMAAEASANSSWRLVPSGRGDGRYSTTLNAEAPGLYRLQMQATRGKQVIGEATTHLRRNSGVREAFGDYQHQAMLQRIAALTGGRYWQLDDLADLPEAIRYSHAGRIEQETFDLWNVPALFLLLLLLKSGEWLLRRAWGRL